MTTKAQEFIENAKVTVCDSCLMASCWQGIFMCEDARTAGTTEKTVKELRELGREHPDYFINDHEKEWRE